MTECPHCAAAQVDPLHIVRGADCIGCEARSIADAALTWEAPKNSPRTRWHLIADLMRIIWRDEQRRQEGRRLVWLWVVRMKRAEAAS